MTKAIYFDMDGTIADLYHQKHWLKDLRAEKTRPYEKAQPMLCVSDLKKALDALRAKGYIIGVISWQSKASSPAYAKATTVAKVDWLDKHFGLGYFDRVHIVKYGTPKHEVATVKDAILFDDNSDIRKDWALGAAYNEKNILHTLLNLG